MITHKDFIFTHLQKCGGSFVEKFLLTNIKGCESAWPKHRGIITMYPEAENKLKFGVIRNPFEWYVSWWSANSQAKTTLFPKIFTKETKEDFNKFIEVVGNAEFGNQHDLVGDYISKNNIGILTYRFIAAFTDGQKDVMDKIIKLENLYEGLNEVLKLDSDLQTILESMTKVHTSKHDHYSKYYTDSSIEIIKNKDKDILERFGYSYEKNSDY